MHDTKSGMRGRSRLRAMTGTVAVITAVLTQRGSAATVQSDDNPYLHVWVHYDYMVAPDHSDEPSAAAIRMVVDAFRRHGVILHIDPRHAAIPARTVIVPDWPSQYASVPGFDSPACTGPDAVRFSDLRAQYFESDLNHAWHYAIFGEYVATDSPADSNNCPEVTENGNRPPLAGMTGDSQVGFLDSPGSFGYAFVVALKGVRDVEPLTDQNEAAIFMHELGHNLGLCHGGPNLDRCASGGSGLDAKPNYLSVMNRDFELIGIPYASLPGSTDIAGYRLDYSDVRLPDLDENKLVETVGLQDAIHQTDISFSDGINSYVPAWGAVDWNQNGVVTDAGLAIDVNADLLEGVLQGADDWAWIHNRLNPPSVTSLTGLLPGGAARVGDFAEIRGINLMVPATVLFAGKAVTTVDSLNFDMSPDTRFAVIVPPGARSGPVTVITPEGRATSSQSLTIVR